MRRRPTLYRVRRAHLGNIHQSVLSWRIDVGKSADRYITTRAQAVSTSRPCLLYPRLGSWHGPEPYCRGNGPKSLHTHQVSYIIAAVMAYNSRRLERRRVAETADRRACPRPHSRLGELLSDVEPSMRQTTFSPPRQSGSETDAVLACDRESKHDRACVFTQALSRLLSWASKQHTM